MCASVPLVICCSTAGEKEKEELPSVPCTVMCRQLGLGVVDALIRRQLAPPCMCRLSQPWARHDGRVLTPVNCLCVLLCVNTCMCHPAGLRQCLTAICSGAFVPRHPPPPGSPVPPHSAQHTMVYTGADGGCRPRQQQRSGSSTMCLFWSCVVQMRREPLRVPLCVPRSEF
jgi:hypothetical protein